MSRSLSGRSMTLLENYEKGGVLEQSQGWEKRLKKEAGDRACRALKARLGVRPLLRTMRTLKGLTVGR